jgi:hypothetical protein
MAETRERGSDGATRLIDSVQDMEQSAVEAVRKFVDTVDGVFPDVGDEGARRKVIDGAFTMVERLVGASNRFAQDVVRTTERAIDRLDREASTTTS